MNLKKLDSELLEIQAQYDINKYDLDKLTKLNGELYKKMMSIKKDISKIKTKKFKDTTIGKRIIWFRSTYESDRISMAEEWLNAAKDKKIYVRSDIIEYANSINIEYLADIFAATNTREELIRAIGGYYQGLYFFPSRIDGLKDNISTLNDNTN